MAKKTKTKTVMCFGCTKAFKTEAGRDSHAQAKRHKPYAPTTTNSTKAATKAQKATVSARSVTSWGCMWCTKIFASSAALTSHQRQEHPPVFVASGSSKAPAAQKKPAPSVPKYMCPTCALPFSDQLALCMHHEASHAKAVGRYRFCAPCQKFVLFTKGHFKASPNHPTCPICQDGFEDEIRLNWHKLASHTCDVCKVYCKTAEALREHQASQKHLACGGCGTSVKDSAGLLKRMPECPTSWYAESGVTSEMLQTIQISNSSEDRTSVADGEPPQQLPQHSMPSKEGDSPSTTCKSSASPSTDPDTIADHPVEISNSESEGTPSSVSSLPPSTLHATTEDEGDGGEADESASVVSYASYVEVESAPSVAATTAASSTIEVVPTSQASEEGGRPLEADATPVLSPPARGSDTGMPPSPDEISRFLALFARWYGPNVARQVQDVLEDTEAAGGQPQADEERAEPAEEHAESTDDSPAASPGSERSADSAGSITPCPRPLKPEHQYIIVPTPRSVQSVSLTEGSTAHAGQEPPVTMEATISKPSEPTTPTLSWSCRSCKRAECDAPVATVCGHIFCQGCLITELAATGVCPVCKRLFMLHLDVRN
ncbi:hypothetical protein BD413DRAFT_516089 [Trametes elegans]|nr:hypothetical protein BD413DRAFT_516089 [Trametes elegans]